MYRTAFDMVGIQLSNLHPEYMYMCESMAKLVCRCSNLKSDSINYKGTCLSNRACENCDMFQEENLEHVMLHCPNNADIQDKLMSDIKELELRCNSTMVNDGQILSNLLGKPINGIDMRTMMEFWMIAGGAISSMFTRT